MTKLSILFFSALIFCTACSSEKLSSEKAQSILEEKFTIDCRNELKLSASSKVGKTNPYKAKYVALEKKGVLTIKTKIRDEGWWGKFEDLTVKPTPEYERLAKEVSWNQVLYTVAKAGNIKVLGIQNTEQSATVRFTYEKIPNELYQLSKFLDMETHDCLLKGGSVIEASAGFTLFDTGWQLNKY